ncbi:hypothetical protein CCACVL1_22490 [Corchorus capsularis]|uniref:Uncharacterized protein n=1 Tax=Corchorus capsularis TaxID=210143 RepID=A0A1R3GYB4_COCAP|nr:hypothetical protein CCACVL1_22490 [Corchorus capsularis]
MAVMIKMANVARVIVDVRMDLHASTFIKNNKHKNTFGSHEESKSKAISHWASEVEADKKSDDDFGKQRQKQDEHVFARSEKRLGVHVVQEVKLLAKEDRVALDSAIEELV